MLYKLLPLINIALIVYAILHIKKINMQPFSKLLWVLFIIFVPVIGPITTTIVLNKNSV